MLVGIKDRGDVVASTLPIENKQRHIVLASGLFLTYLQENDVNSTIAQFSSVLHSKRFYDDFLFRSSFVRNAHDCLHGFL